MICFNLKIPKNFIFLIHQDGSWFLHVSFVFRVNKAESKCRILQVLCLSPSVSLTLMPLSNLLRNKKSFYITVSCLFISSYMATQHLFYGILRLICYYLLVLTYQFECTFFFYSPKPLYLDYCFFCFVLFCFFFVFYQFGSQVPENRSSFAFCY